MALTCRELGSKLEELRAKGLFCDASVVFPKDGQKMDVHRNILASCSEYFRTLFTSTLTDSGSIEVEIPGVSHSDMQAIVQYAYTHEVELSPHNVESIMVTSDRLNVLGLLKKCCDYLLEHMNADNALGIMTIARYLHCPATEKTANAFVLSNFPDIAFDSNEFLQLTPDDLTKILQSDELVIDSEDHASSAVVRWTDFNPDVRSVFLPKLFKAVRLGLLSAEAYGEIMKKYSHLSTESEAARLLNKGYELCTEMLDLCPWTRSLQVCQSLSNPMLRPRLPSEVIFVLGGWSRDGVCEDMETFDNRVNRWYEIPKASFEHSIAYHAMVSYGKALYVIGGFTTVKYLNSAKKFDPQSKTWIEIAPMHISRCYVCAAAVDDMIYACGCFDGTVRHSSVERYSPEKNQWAMVADMNSVRSDAGACGIAGKLYVAGGFSGLECLDTVECFDPSVDQWTLLSSMSFRRSGVTVVAFKEAVYAIGGFNGSVRLEEVEKYYPDRDAWFPVKEMIKGRSNFAAAVVEKRIYVIGGYDGSGTTGHVEFYDSTKDEWLETNCLRVGRSAASACTIKGLDNAMEYTFYGTEAHLYLCYGHDRKTHTKTRRAERTRRHRQSAVAEPLNDH